MIKWIKDVFFRYKQTEKSNVDTKNLYKAKKNALLALDYWKNCMEESDLHFQIEDSSIFVRLGKGSSCQAGRNK